jgi:hypothetical protein
MAPTVSIVVPCFNRLKYLRGAIGSVLEQTFSDWELLIVDDGSDAETRNYPQWRLGALQVSALAAAPAAMRGVLRGHRRARDVQPEPGARAGVARH